MRSSPASNHAKNTTPFQLRHQPAFPVIPRIFLNSLSRVILWNQTTYGHKIVRRQLRHCRQITDGFSRNSRDFKGMPQSIRERSNLPKCRKVEAVGGTEVN